LNTPSLVRNPHNIRFYAKFSCFFAEEITGIDVVAAQIQIAAGATLPQLGLTQEAISKRGFAIQCRVTTEDPATNFQPDMGKIEVYRSAGGNGVRLDASSGFAGAQITASPPSLSDLMAAAIDLGGTSPTTTVFSSRFPSVGQHTKLPDGRCSERWWNSVLGVSRFVHCVWSSLASASYSRIRRPTSRSCSASLLTTFLLGGRHGPQ